MTRLNVKSNCRRSFGLVLGLLQTYPKIRSKAVEDMSEVIHPHLSHPGRVVAIVIFITWEPVRVRFAEEMSHMGTWDKLDGASALPNLMENYIQLLTHKPM